MLSFLKKRLLQKEQSARPKNQFPLYFKTGDDFFEYQCEYGETTIRANIAIVALVLDPKNFGVLEGPDHPASGFQRVMLKVASKDGGFVVFSQTNSSNEVLLKEGDIVFWVPVKHSNDIGKVFGDERSGWVGFIVAKLRPEILPSATATNGFVIEYTF